MGYAIAALIAALIFELITWGIEYEFFYRPFVMEFIRSGRFNTPRFERAYYKKIKQIALVAIAGSIDMIVFLSSSWTTNRSSLIPSSQASTFFCF